MQLGMARTSPFAFSTRSESLMQGGPATVGWGLLSGVSVAFASMWMGYMSGPLNLLARLVLCQQGAGLQYGPPPRSGLALLAIGALPEGHDDNKSRVFNIRLPPVKYLGWVRWRVSFIPNDNPSFPKGQQPSVSALAGLASSLQGPNKLGA